MDPYKKGWNYCEDVVIQDCEIYECSLNGVFLNGDSKMRIQNCFFHDIGYFQRDDGDGYCLLSASGVDGVEITDCRIDRCCLYCMLVCFKSTDVVFEEQPLYKQ